MISDLVALGMPINSLAKRLEKLFATMFGLCLDKDKGILRKFAKVKEIKRAFELKPKCSFGKLVDCGQPFAFPRQCMSLGCLLSLTLASLYLAEHDLLLYLSF
ncbi:hypothetical protein D8674_010554 [Pyrus ussuriensis x Pyrus communis]|uniref:Uncharacterized protein n=1 Tax=Pyrus ussuriensis x Pyrus communis TaxID=2448454 RepID=A0A5N5FBR9_9ROSA|nr:hypothetical protein D8674_010554 [Pyrus ussuriensis x Pyrus communis]